MPSVFYGPRVHLRAFSAKDAAVYRTWNEDTDQARALDSVPWPRSPEADQRWADAEVSRPPDGDNVRLVIANADDEAIGDITVHHAEPRNGTFSYGISVRADQRGHGYAAEAIKLLLRVMFDERRYRKVTVEVFAFNPASIALHRRLGFREEGRLREMTYAGGAYHDTLVFGLTRDEWRARHAKSGPTPMT